MKRYIKSSISDIAIPEGARKYYKFETDSTENLEELANIFRTFRLEFIAPLEAKARYADYLDNADLTLASLCRRPDGTAGVYVLTGDSAEDITDPRIIKEAVDRARRYYKERGYQWFY